MCCQGFLVELFQCVLTLTVWKFFTGSTQNCCVQSQLGIKEYECQLWHWQDIHR